MNNERDSLNETKKPDTEEQDTVDLTEEKKYQQAIFFRAERPAQVTAAQEKNEDESLLAVLTAEDPYEEFKDPFETFSSDSDIDEEENTEASSQSEPAAPAKKEEKSHKAPEVFNTPEPATASIMNAGKNNAPDQDTFTIAALQSSLVPQSLHFPESLAGRIVSKEL